MKKTALLCFLFLTAFAGAQNKGNTPAKDWDQLDKAFIALVDALQKNDKAAFMAISRPQVDCQDCINSTESESEGYFVPAGIFFEKLSKDFTKSPVYKAMVTRGYLFSAMEIKTPSKGGRTGLLKVYEVWVDTYLRNEWAEGHEGTSHKFQFVKVNGQFKFYGLTSIP